MAEHTSSTIVAVAVLPPKDIVIPLKQSAPEPNWAALSATTNSEATFVLPQAPLFVLIGSGNL